MESVRKHYLSNHRVGDDVLIAAEAFQYAARTPGARVEMVEGAAVVVQGDAAPEAVEEFARHARQMSAELDRRAA